MLTSFYTRKREGGERNSTVPYFIRIGLRHRIEPCQMLRLPVGIAEGSAAHA